MHYAITNIILLGRCNYSVPCIDNFDASILDKSDDGQLGIDESQISLTPEYPDPPPPTPTPTPTQPGSH